MNLLHLRPDRFFNTVYYMVKRNVKPEDYDEFDRSLAEPLPTPPGFGKKKPTALELEIEGQDFLALYAQVKGG